MSRRTVNARASCGLAAWLLLLVIGGTSSARAAELLMFEDRGCPWCERWRQEVGVAYPNTPEGQRAPLRRIELPRARESGVQLAGAITVSPTFVLAADGREVGRIIGYPGADFFWGMLADLMTKLDRNSSAAFSSGIIVHLLPPFRSTATTALATAP